MHNAKLRTVAQYVIPAICSNVCFFLFTIVDAIFVGRGGAGQTRWGQSIWPVPPY